MDKENLAIYAVKVLIDEISLSMPRWYNVDDKHSERLRLCVSLITGAQKIIDGVVESGGQQPVIT